MKPQQRQRNCTPLAKPNEDILKKLLDARLITLPKIRQEDPNGVRTQWYRDDEFCAFHHQRGHATKKYQHLRAIIQRVIDNGHVSTRAPQAQSNMDLGVYQTFTRAWYKCKSSKYCVFHVKTSNTWWSLTHWVCWYDGYRSSSCCYSYQKGRWKSTCT